MREKRKKMPKTVCHDDRLTNRSNERMSKLSERLALRLACYSRFREMAFGVFVGFVKQCKSRASAGLVVR